jgi:hypothetical protein
LVKCVNSLKFAGKNVSKPLSRRHFILTTTAGSIGLAASRTNLAHAALLTTHSLPENIIPIPHPANAPIQPVNTASTFPTDPSGLYTLSRSLSEVWAKKLLALQVLDASRPQEYGGILCPTEHIVHGRVGDTIYPFLHMAHRTGDSRYVDASVLLFRWIENNVSQPDGSWLNEPKDSWKGTTVFSVIALCEALLYHGELMDPAFKDAIRARLLKAGNFIYDNVNIDYGNINYPLSASYALSLLGTLEDQPRFSEKGKLLAHQALNFFSRNNHFIFGEGTPYYQASKKGCFSIDLGYNVEETLPSLALYGLLNQDEELLQQVTLSLQTHLEFMLPDGGWDNSWGTRNYKWTWWGSRTSDGCQPAYALLAHRDPRFYRAALKNTELLQNNTIDGLLYGGPHYASHHVPPSVHHTFCHIKALTTILDHNQHTPTAPTPSSTLINAVSTTSSTHPTTPTRPAAAPSTSTTTSSTPTSNTASTAPTNLPNTAATPTHSPGATADPSILPRETPYGLRFFTDIQTWLISTGAFKATVTGYDREYKAMHNGHATGGALTLLWHELTGPLLVASMNNYQLVEAGNMQADKDPLSMPLTPRVELTTNGVTYMNISCLDARITAEEQQNKIIIKTRSKLVDKDQHDPAQGPVYCYADYIFTPQQISLSFRHDPTPYSDSIRIVLPVISRSGEAVAVINDKTIHIQKEKSLVTLKTNQSIQQLPTTDGRLFNFVPGLEAIPFVIHHQPAVIDITIQGTW